MHTCVDVGVQTFPPGPPPYVGDLPLQPSNAVKAPMTRMTRIRMERLPPGVEIVRRTAVIPDSRGGGFVRLLVATLERASRTSLLRHRLEGRAAQRFVHGTERLDRATVGVLQDDPYVTRGNHSNGGCADSATPPGRPQAASGGISVAATEIFPRHSGVMGRAVKCMTGPGIEPGACGLKVLPSVQTQQTDGNASDDLLQVSGAFVPRSPRQSRTVCGAVCGAAP